MTFSIDFKGIHPLWGIFLIVLFTLWLFAYYRKTVPPKTPLVKGILFFLRWTALITVILCLIEPVIHIGFKKSLKPVLAVLLDRSASMSVRDNGSVRSESALDLWQNSRLSSLFNNGSAEGYAFSTEAQSISYAGAKKLRFDGLATDLSTAVRQVLADFNDRNLTGILLISDGAVNLGVDPLRIPGAVDIPFYSIGIGDPEPPKDIRIDRVSSSPVTYAGIETPVEVSVRAENAANIPITVTLKEGSKLLDEKSIIISGSAPEQLVKLNITPEVDGLINYDIEASSPMKESTTKNNRRTLTIRVLKKAVDILLVAGKPSFDLKFLSLNLRQNPDVNLTVLTFKDAQAFYEGDFPGSYEDLSVYDVCILLDVQGSAIEGARESLIEEFVRKGGGLMLLGSHVMEGKTPVLSSLLPVKYFSGAEGFWSGFVPEVTRAGIHHFITSIGDSPLETETMFRKLPPISSFRVVSEVLPGCISLLVHPGEKVKDKKAPILAVSRVDRGRILMGLFSSFWRWDFMMVELPGGRKVFELLLANAVRWLATDESSFMFTLKTDKNDYLGGETVEVSARLFDEGYRPDTGKAINLSLSGTEKIKAIMRDMGDGWYRHKFSGLPPGSYNLSATARPGRQDSLSSTVSFSVDEFSLEHLNTAMNQDLLKRFAAETGGNFATVEGADSLLSSIKFKQAHKFVKYDRELWNRPLAFLVIAVMLCTEWIARKQMGML